MRIKKTKEKKLRNKVNAKNQMNDFLNKISTKLTMDIKENGLRRKIDGNLYKKDKERLDKIIESIPKPENMQAWIQVFLGSVKLHTKISFESGPVSVNYLEDTQYICNLDENDELERFFDWPQRPYYTLDGQLEKMEKLEKIEKKIEELEKEGFELERELI